MIRKVLYLEDSDDDFLLFREALRGLGGGRDDDMFFVDHAPSVQEARGLMAIEHYDVIVVDMKLGADSGVDFVHEIWNSHHQRPMILTSGMKSVEFDARTLEMITHGRLQFISKFELTSERLANAMAEAMRCEWRLLVVNGQRDTASMIREVLSAARDQQFHIDATGSPDSAAAMLRAQRYDACMVDCSLGGDEIDELLWNIGQLELPQRPALIFTGDERRRPDPLLMGSANASDMGFIQTGELSPERLSGTISQTCGETQWRVVSSALYS